MSFLLGYGIMVTKGYCQGKEKLLTKLCVEELAFVLV